MTVSDEDVLVGSWPLGAMEQVITSSDGVLRTVGV